MYSLAVFLKAHSYIHTWEWKWMLKHTHTAHPWKRWRIARWIRERKMDFSRGLFQNKKFK